MISKNQCHGRTWFVIYKASIATTRFHLHYRRNDSAVNAAGEGGVFNDNVPAATTTLRIFPSPIYLLVIHEEATLEAMAESPENERVLTEHIFYKIEIYHQTLLSFTQSSLDLYYTHGCEKYRIWPVVSNNWENTGHSDPQGIYFQ